MNSLIDELAEPPLRFIIGSLLGRCDSADIAVSHMRLAMLDFAESELRRVRRCRILLGRLDARSLGGGSPLPHDLPTARALLHFVRSDRVEIRAAGLASWAPDFSVYRQVDRPEGKRVCLIGAHYFREPAAVNGPSFTACIDDDVAVDLVCSRFEQIWDAGYDVRDTVLAALHAWTCATPAPDGAP
jgi:hypothetical protein